MIKRLKGFRNAVKQGALRRQRKPGGRASRAEYAIFHGDGWPANGARTRDPIEAYRWLQAARAADWPGASLRWLGVRQLGQTRWRRHGPALRVPELAPRVVDAVQTLELSGASEVSVRRARLRVVSLLGCRGLDGATTSSLLPGYEGFFPSADVGVARMLHARLGGEHRPWLRRLDLSALMRDLIAGAVIWTLPERGDLRWPAGVHLFTARSHRATRRHEL